MSTVGVGVEVGVEVECLWLDGCRSGELTGGDDDERRKTGFGPINRRGASPSQACVYGSFQAGVKKVKVLSPHSLSLPGPSCPRSE